MSSCTHLYIMGPFFRIMAFHLHWWSVKQQTELKVVVLPTLQNFSNVYCNQCSFLELFRSYMRTEKQYFPLSLSGRLEVFGKLLTADWVTFHTQENRENIQSFRTGWLRQIVALDGSSGALQGGIDQPKIFTGCCKQMVDEDRWSVSVQSMNNLLKEIIRWLHII